MPKSISAGLDTHLAGPTTSIATLWRVTRQDQQSFYFTDHDKNIIFNGATYLAFTGYNRSAIQNDASLAVDNLDIEAFFDSSSITESDLRGGKYDFADVVVSMVNWRDLTQGEVILRTGKLGEVSANRQGTYTAELRGLTQILSQRIGELVSPECRYDLGNDKCMIPILPDLVQRSTAYSLGDYVRVNTNGVQPIDLGLTNPDLESLTGWTTNSGTPAIVASDGSLSPQSGSNFLQGGIDTGYEIEQVKDVSVILNTTKIDNGDYVMDFSIWLALGGSDTDDTIRVHVEFLDGSLVFIDDMLDTGTISPSPTNTWEQHQATDIKVPVNTRNIRVTITGTRVTEASIVHASADNIISEFRDQATLDNEGDEIYENRIYECTTAGTTAATEPTYDTTVGNTTNDGTAVFTARESWTRSAQIDTVTDQTTFTLKNLTESRAVDDWFNGGLLTFHGTSLNSGLSIEIRDWTQTGSTIVVFLPMPFVVSADDKVSLYPGCDKTRDECRVKFSNVINFGGEPDVPGNDELTSFPDSNL